MASTMVHVRVDDQIKQDATEALEAMGLSVSDAVRVFLTRVAAEKRLPFALRVPNTETRAAIEEGKEIIRANRARFATAGELFDDLEKKQQQVSERLSRDPAIQRLCEKILEGLGAAFAIRPV